MRILVTGGTGFVGRHLLRRLGQRKHTIFATYLGTVDMIAYQAREVPSLI